MTTEPAHTPADATDAPDAPAPWPVTVHARWTDPGHTRGEFLAVLGLFIGTTWAVGFVLITGASSDLVLALFPLALAAWAAFLFARRNPVDLELTLAPERLTFVRGGIDRLELVVPRDDPGWVVAARMTVGALDRLLLILDEPGNERTRFRATVAAVTFDGLDGPGVAAWWPEAMPAGTSPATPPATLPVAPLVGDWWPDPTHRLSLRGNGARIRWAEPTMTAWPRDDLRRRRTVLAVSAVVLGVLVLGALRGGTTTALVAIVPPAILGIAAVAAWLFGRRR